MTFKEWCMYHFGILSLFEGKIVNQVFLPINPALQFVERKDLILPEIYLGERLNLEGKDGFILSKEEGYEKLKDELRNFYDLHPSLVDKISFRDYLTYYFASKGVDYKDIKENNFFPDIHVVFDDDKKSNMHLFMQKFAAFHPSRIDNIYFDHSAVAALSEYPFCYVMKPGFLQELYKHYLQDPEANINQTFDIERLKSFQTAIQHDISLFSESYGGMSESMDNAHRLALDHNNDVGLTTTGACSSYAASLRIYANLNYSHLSPDEYTRLLYAANLLEQTQVGLPCLGDDADKMKKHEDDYRTYRHRIYPDGPKPTLAELDIAGTLILNKMKDDIDDLCQHFLPDREMKSDTDVITLQGGGKATHSAIFRIIKVGIMKNGKPAQQDEVPHHYDYYKIEDDLKGSRERDERYHTCTGTYVTKLTPFKKMSDGSISPANIDPFKNPAAYQEKMAETIKELILVEHQLMLYDKSSSSRSSEFKEWQRLNHLKNMLSGEPYRKSLQYFAQDPLDPTKKFILEVRNQKGYAQGSGSCTMFSLKSLMNSVLGPELATRHIDYLQRHNTDGHIHSLKMLEKELEVKIALSSKLLTLPALSQQSTDKTCQEILTKIQAYEKHLVEELGKYSGQQNKMIQNKLKLIQRYRDIIKSSSDSHSKLLYFIECLIKKPLEGEQSAIEILSTPLAQLTLSQIFPASFARMLPLPVKGKELLKDIETILGTSLIEITEAEAKPVSVPPPSL